MRIKSITLAFLVSFCIHTFAFTPINPRTTIHGFNFQHTSIAKKVQNEFIDFSGSWKGTCTFDNYKTEEMVVIKNSARSIEFGTKLFLIGNSLHSEANGSSQGTFFDHKQFQWSQDGTSLIMQGIKVVSQNAPVTTYLFTNIMSLINDQIVISIKVKAFQNLEMIAEDKGHCLLSRI